MAFGQTGINTGTGAEVTTDLVGTAVTQVVKLDGGVTGASAPILGSTANGLQVDVTRVVDGALVTLGALADVAVGDASGSVNAHLRQIAKLLAATLVVSGSGNFAVTAADGSSTTLGALADAAVGDASGSVNAHLRQIAKLLAASLAVTAIDGANVTQGALADAAVTTDAAGTLSGKLRGLVKILADVWDGLNHWLSVRVATALPTGTNKIGGVTLADGDAPTLGALADAAVGDASGSVNAHLRQIAKLLAAALAVSVGDGADVAQGALADAAITTNAAGSLSGKLRGLVAIFADVWDGTNHWLKCAAQGMAATGVAVVGNPLYMGGKDTGGLVQPLAINTFVDVNGAAVPGTTAQRVVADLMIQDAADNVTSRIRCAKDLVTGVGGSTLLGQASGIYQTSDGKFYPLEGTQTGGAFVQGPVADGVTASGNPVMSGGYDGTAARRLKVNTDGSLPIGGFTKRLTASPTIKTTAFAAGQNMGGLITLTNAVRLSGGTGAIQTVVITDKSNQKSAIDVVFFSANPTNTTFTDGTTLAVNAIDLITILGTVSILASNYVSFSANAVATIANAGIALTQVTGTSLYCALVSRGTPTYAGATDLELALGVAQD